jgi:dolichyl-diphosphooligosaccharide--protein glycosyltransferase
MSDSPSPWNAPGAAHGRTRWLWPVLLCLLAYGLALEARLAELPKWQSAEFQAAGEYLAATHDSYAWLAGAQGLGDYAAFPFARLTRTLEEITGARPGNLALWAPAFFAALVAPATLLWGLLLGGRTAGLAAGLTGAILPGFFIRTRMGYWDTDVFTLLGPLVAALCLAALPGQAPAWTGLAAGLLCRFLNLPHHANVSLGFLTLALAVSLLLCRTSGPALARGLRLYLVFGLAAFPGWQDGAPPWQPGLGLVLAAGLALPPRLRLRGAQRVLDRPSVWLAALALLLLAVQAQDSLLELLRQAGDYLRPASDGGAPGGPLWPGVTQSIREVLVIDIPDTLARLGGTAWAGGAGLACLPLLFALRPRALLLLPTLGLGLASLWLGNRFSMYGGPAVVLGLGVCLDLALRRLWTGRGREIAALAAQCGLALALILPLAGLYRELPVNPVLDQAHAEALLDLRRQAPPGSLVWTWWDYGYAAQYFAQIRTAVDGGRHQGRDLYPLALALTTQSARQAAQVLRLAAADPEARWSRGDAAQAQKFLARLKERDLDLPPGPPLYLVVAWDDLNLARWITFYGQWNLAAGASSGGEILRLRSDADIDMERGVVALRHSGEAVRLAGMEFFTGRDVLRRSYDRGDGPRLALNVGRNEAYLLGAPVRRSMLARLLLDDPAEPDLAAAFRLVVDRSPDVRIYAIR